MSSLTSKSTNGKTRWRLQFRIDGSLKQIRLGCIRKSAANKIQRMVDDLANCQRLNIKPDIQTQEWLQSVDWKLIDRMQTLGLLECVSDLIQRRREDENSDPSVMMTPVEFSNWYIKQRKPNVESSTLAKMRSSLQALCDYCQDHETVSNVEQIDSAMAYRFKMHRGQTKAEATVSKDIKIAKTAFTWAVNAGHIADNPFTGIKAGKDVNPDGQQIVTISEFDRLIDACPDSTWRAIIALARLGGLRCPSELSNLRWTDVNWHAGTLRVTSPKTKRHGKAERVLPLFKKLDEVLSDHWELTGEHSEYVVDNPTLRRAGASLSGRFHRIASKAGLPKIQNPFRNLRLSATNDVCRIPGITPATIVDWFGHDLKTAMKHYHRTTDRDFDAALTADPFVDQVISPKSFGKPAEKLATLVATSCPRTGENDKAEMQKLRETKVSRSLHKQKVTPTGLRIVPKTWELSGAILNPT